MRLLLCEIDRQLHFRCDIFKRLAGSLECGEEPRHPFCVVLREDCGLSARKMLSGEFGLGFGDTTRMLDARAGGSAIGSRPVALTPRQKSADPPARLRRHP